MPILDAANEADIPALCELLACLFAQESEFSPDAVAQRKGLHLLLRQPEAGAILVARAGSQVVAMVNLLFTISTALGARVAILEDMVVAPAARRAGIGSALLQHAIDYSQSMGIERLTLLTDGNNHGAQRFYQRHGFAGSTMVPMRLGLRPTRPSGP